MADGAEVDGVEAAELIEDGVREDVAGLLVALAAEVVVFERVLEAGLGGCGLEDLQPFADDLGAGAVAGQDSDAVVAGGHGRTPSGVR